MSTLNNAQIEILKLFNKHQTEEDLKEIKSLLIAYLADKVVREADASFVEKNYDVNAIFEEWKYFHFRKTA